MGKQPLEQFHRPALGLVGVSQHAGAWVLECSCDKWNYDSGEFFNPPFIAGSVHFHCSILTCLCFWSCYPSPAMSSEMVEAQAQVMSCTFRQIKYRPEKASTAEFWELSVFLAEQCQKIISLRSRKCSCVMLSHDLPCYVNLTWNTGELNTSWMLKTNQPNCSNENVCAKIQCKLSSAISIINNWLLQVSRGTLSCRDPWHDCGTSCQNCCRGRAGIQWHERCFRKPEKTAWNPPAWASG